ncbi:Ferredoxin-thioredoxin reductase, catalytic subunit [Dehalogenimonas formicexedens]|uniref:ferredoxin:thioredoxin reductase n=1 Tax=Dehalogenimonas formicexedens TaxID=1839801 RepID=A0A1P8F5J7_9CHLR|nr:ferredoxin-thioredoxin reductase catalytic domain-containing protein [Dehalogenimonas formicexedens]APV43751.1 Ferredoxin-thioredoxin reductase, catalytic subunit [Dehalogenimonas formicexedens]
MSGAAPDSAGIDRLYAKLNAEAEKSGYHLNPDIEFTRSLVEGLLTNMCRYGYMACPCRLASGVRAQDLDIICPCDYRDPDLSEFGACYCALYVNTAILQGKQELKPVPERRGRKMVEKNQESMSTGGVTIKLSQPVWRCKVCGYLCGRGEPPEICPICKATKDRFERFV